MRIERIGPKSHQGRGGGYRQTCAEDMGAPSPITEQDDRPVTELPAVIPGQARQKREAFSELSSQRTPNAAFVTQLIAHKLDLETTRARRRAAPDVADAAYQATVARNKQGARSIAGFLLA